MGRHGRVWLAVGTLAMAGPGCNEGDTITAPTLAATCSATPSEGAAPLEVAFALGVSGAEGGVSVQVSYGDGATGTDPDATHTYVEAGLFTASFVVSTPTQSARCATTVDVSAGAAAGTADGNGPPVTDFKTTPDAVGGGISGPAPLLVKYNICSTEDPDGDTVLFTMDLDGDGKLDMKGDTGGACRMQWTYAMGTWFAEVCVTDLAPNRAPLHDPNCRAYTIIAR